jgi:hypothetical protein
MATRDIRSNLEGQLVFNATVSSDTTTAGTIIDTADYDGGIKLDFIVSAYTDGTYTPLLQESDDSGMSGATDIPDAALIGTEAGAALSAVTADTEVLKSLGFFSNKRYVQVSLVSTAVTTGATLQVVAQKMPEVTPVDGLSA